MSSSWFLLQRIRAACGNQVSKILSGFVEADETFVGGKEGNKHANKKLRQGRGTVGKTIVFGMRDREGQVMAKVPQELLSLQRLQKGFYNPCRDDISSVSRSAAQMAMGNVLDGYGTGRNFINGIIEANRH